MSPTTRATKKQAKTKKQRKRKSTTPSSATGDRRSASVEHVGQHHTDDFLKEITKHAPWEAWADKLAARRSPLSLNKLMPKAGECPLSWSTDDEMSAASLQLLDWLYALRRRRHRDEVPGDWSVVTEEWLDSLETRPVTVGLVLEAIGFVHALPRLATRVPAPHWSRLVNCLVDLAAGSVSAELFEEATANQLLLAQLTAGELPLALAYVFPKVEACQQLGRPGRAAVANGLLAALDGEGILQSRFVNSWRQLLSCWTRCFYLDANVSGKSMPKDSRLQFEWLVRQSLRFQRSDGTMIMSGDMAAIDQRGGLLKSALEIGGDRIDRELFEVQRGRVKAADSSFALPSAGEHSEWAELALLRCRWSANSPYLALTYPEGTFASEMAVGRRRIWSGANLPELRVDGSPLDVDGQWDELCWASDKDMDYVELEIDLSKGWKLQRQYLLARADQFLFSADTLVGPRSGQLDYRLELPLDPKVDVHREQDTAEVRWVADKPIAWAHPLALCEWRTDSRQGRFDGRVLYQTGTGTALYAPLLIDFHPKRASKARTWRQLTVAEDLKLLPRDVAVAYRVQIGSRQWVIYRSLGKPRSRTFIGQNVTSEFLVARFGSDGELENLIEIE